MRRAWHTWAAIAGLYGDAIRTFILTPMANVLRLVDDAHDTEPDGDES